MLLTGNLKPIYNQPAAGRGWPTPHRPSDAPSRGLRPARPSTASVCVTAPSGPQTPAVASPGRRGHAGGAAPASTRHGYLQRSSASKASRSGRDPRGFCRPRERKTGGGVGLGSWPISAQAEVARSPTSPRALKVTGRAGRHGGAGPYAVCVMSSAPGSFRRPEVLELSLASFGLPV